MSFTSKHSSISKMSHLLVNCKNYNGYMNTLFMIKKTDKMALSNGDKNNVIIEEGKYSKKTFNTVSGRSFAVHADMSLTENI